jgi:hypothetical protein
MGRTECNRIVNFDGGPLSRTRLVGRMIDVRITRRCRIRCAERSSIERQALARLSRAGRCFCLVSVDPTIRPCLSSPSV